MKLNADKGAFTMPWADAERPRAKSDETANNRKVDLRDCCLKTLCCPNQGNLSNFKPLQK